MKTLAIDIETYSDIDLTKAGVYAYSASPRFEILLFAYAFDDAPVSIVDFTNGEELPEDVRTALADDGVVKTAFNAAFERTCLRAGSAFGFNRFHGNAQPCSQPCSPFRFPSTALARF